MNVEVPKDSPRKSEAPTPRRQDNHRAKSDGRIPTSNMGEASKQTPRVELQLVGETHQSPAVKDVGGMAGPPAVKKAMSTDKLDGTFIRHHRCTDANILYE